MRSAVPRGFAQDVPLAIVQQYLIDQRPVPPFRQHQIKMTVPVQVAKADVGGRFGCLFQQLNTIEAHRRLLSGNSQPEEENDREGEAAGLHQPQIIDMRPSGAARVKFARFRWRKEQMAQFSADT